MNGFQLDIDRGFCMFECEEESCSACAWEDKNIYDDQGRIIGQKACDHYQLPGEIASHIGGKICDCPISGFTVTHDKDCPEGHGA